MTLVIAGIGTDGVVIASDRAETNESTVRMVDKIYPLKCGLFSFAGDLGVAQKIMDGINTLDLLDEPFLSQVVNIENVAKDVNKRYKRNGDVSAHFFLTMIDDTGKPLVQYFDDDGTSMRITEYDCIGSGSGQALYFLKVLYKPDMTCDELAQIFSFIIQLISDSGINSSVQVSKEFPAEVYIINSLNSRKPYMYQNEFLWEMNEDQIKSLNKFIPSLISSENTTQNLEVAKRYW